MSCAQSSILYLPLLRMFRNSEALAADATAKPNVIFAYYPLGGYQSDLVFPGGGDGPIGSFPQNYKSIEDLGLKDQFLLYDGLNFKGTENHNGAHTQVFAGWGRANHDTGYGLLSSGIVFNHNDQKVDANDVDPTPYSLDQQLATRWGVKSMVLGAVTGKDYTAFYEAFSFKSAGEHIYAEDNPATSFGNFFGAFKSGSSTGSTSQMAAEKKVALAEAKVLDFLTADLKRIETSLGSEDKAAFQAHLSALHSLNQDIVNAKMIDMSAACGAAGVQTKIPGDDSRWWADEDKIGLVLEINRGLLVQGIACGITRVGVYQIGCTHSTKQLRASGIPKKMDKDYHEMSHGDIPGSVPIFAEIQAGLVKEIAKIAVDLKAINSGSGNLFDNTLIYGTSCGGTDSGHGGGRVPTFTLGSLGGKINSGRKVKADSYNKALVTVAHAVGETSITYVGNKTQTGPISGVLK
ncbi:MAG: DUF1552 domain-containing protein [Chitinophagaceae bacterium]|nr:DUF1552 domain-containing protein [Oligoflexus sp.]